MAVRLAGNRRVGRPVGWSSVEGLAGVGRCCIMTWWDQLTDYLGSWPPRHLRRSFFYSGINFSLPHPPCSCLPAAAPAAYSMDRLVSSPRLHNHHVLPRLRVRLCPCFTRRSLFPSRTPNALKLSISLPPCTLTTPSHPPSLPPSFPPSLPTVCSSFHRGSLSGIG